MHVDAENGPDFELRALSVARAIHDPFGLQGSEMHDGKERDAVFDSESSVHVYEFTIDRTRAKAKKDGEKIAHLLRSFAAKPENAFKSTTGWFVTREEPTADQRSEIVAIAKKNSVPIHAISISTLQQRICNSEEYLQARDSAPFGSIGFAPAASGAEFRVDVALDSDAGSLTVADVFNAVLEGRRFVVTGDFGVGKSHGLRELYRVLRREHFRRKKLTPFPLHINLRDCIGLRTPAEIIRRHAEDIGFKSESSLMSAWRSGACVILLDGFDEVVPVKWLGNATDLKTVRWEALAPVRRFVEETPPGAGIVVCGRPNYFSSSNEMLDALGLGTRATHLRLTDFTDSQIRDYLKLAQVDWEVPDWIPGRPLLLGYLAAMRESEPDDSKHHSLERSEAWRQLLTAICQRESRMFSAVRPETIRAIVARVATLARSTGNETGPIGMELMRSAFIAVNARQPDEEGIQLLLRLPGLTIDGGSAETDSRVFADKDLAETAYGEDLAAYLADPHGEHPLKELASWVSATSDLGIGVARSALEEMAVSGGAVVSTAVQRQNSGQYDSILADSLRVATELGAEDLKGKQTFLVEGVIFDDLILGGDALTSRVSFVDCIFQRIDLSGVDQGTAAPHFQRGIVGLLDGVTGVPAWLSENFAAVEIESFSSKSQTTAGIMQLNLGSGDRIALSILKKIYGQRGTGRKEGALSRGIDLSLRPLVPNVIATMVSEGWIQKSSAGRNVLYVAVKERRAEALRALESPNDFRLKGSR